MPDRDVGPAAMRQELLRISPATIDRYLRTVKATNQIRGVSPTRPSSLLRLDHDLLPTGEREIPFAIGFGLESGTEFLTRRFYYRCDTLCSGASAAGGPDRGTSACVGCEPTFVGQQR